VAFIREIVSSARRRMETSEKPVNSLDEDEKREVEVALGGVEVERAVPVNAVANGSRRRN
jgi:hypothetical protein